MGKDELVHTILAVRDTLLTPEEAKSAILSWFLENLPKEKGAEWTSYYKDGFNSCLAEIKRRMG